MEGCIIFVMEEGIMNRIVIIGCGGAGKSTLARQLGQKLDIPVVHLDKLFWTPGWVSLPPEEFDPLVEAELQKARWIMDGNFNRTIHKRLEKCDTVIYLDFSRAACLLGVLKRIATTYGTVRPDMGEGCPERIDGEFLRWVWNYNKNKRQKTYDLIVKYPHVKLVVLKNRRQVSKFLGGV